MFYTNLKRIQADIEAMAKFNSTEGKGLTRFSFSKEHKDTADYIMSEMKNAGLDVRVDPCGTIIGRLEGQDPSAPVVMTGSHFDSVRCGGNFDGPAGVVTGLEIARVFKEKNLKPYNPIEFIAMIEEEGARFGGGLFASRAMVGKVTEDDLENKDSEGISMREAIKDFGLNPDDYKKAIRKKGDIKGFIELHIEQGPILEANNTDIGIVETIVGLKLIKIVIKGRPGHAGTTPMDMRNDAYLVASKVALSINSFAKEEGNGTVATVGRVIVRPNSFNIIPGEVEFYVDMRSKTQECIDNLYKKLTEELENLTSGQEFLSYELKVMLETSPVNSSKEICATLEEKAKNLGFSYRKMLSGAGHDAMIMADIAPIGLVFVPSKDGRSHCPEEWTDYDLLQKGIETVCNAIIEMSGTKVQGN